MKLDIIDNLLTIEFHTKEEMSLFDDMIEFYDFPDEYEVVFKLNIRKHQLVLQIDD